MWYDWAMNTTDTPVISGAAIGVFRLKMLIVGCEMEGKTGMQLTRGDSSLKILKRDLGIRGNREKVLAIAKASLANVELW